MPVNNIPIAASDISYDYIHETVSQYHKNRDCVQAVLFLDTLLYKYIDKKCDLWCMCMRLLYHAMMSAGMEHSAICIIDKLVYEMPSDYYGCQTLANHYWQIENNTSKAIQCVHNYLRHVIHSHESENEDVIQGNNLLARLYLAHGDSDKALACVAESLSRLPDYNPSNGYVFDAEMLSDFINKNVRSEILNQYAQKIGDTRYLVSEFNDIQETNLKKLFDM